MYQLLKLIPQFSLYFCHNNPTKHTKSQGSIGCWVQTCDTIEGFRDCQQFSLAANFFWWWPLLFALVAVVVNDVLMWLYFRDQVTIKAAKLRAVQKKAKQEQRDNVDRDSTVSSSSEDGDDLADSGHNSRKREGHENEESIATQTPTPAPTPAEVTAKEELRKQKRKLGVMTAQCLFFVGAFAITQVPTQVLRFHVSNPHEQTTLRILQAICYPMQGFFNTFVYLKPRYASARYRFKGESVWWCVRRAVWGEAVEPTKSTGDDVALNDDDSV